MTEWGAGISSLDKETAGATAGACFENKQHGLRLGPLLRGIVLDLGTGTFFESSTEQDRGKAIDYECKEGYGRLAIGRSSR